jgi:hypothetical protein
LLEDLKFKLALSEKGNGLLASRLSMKSDQLKDYFERAGGGGVDSTSGKHQTSENAAVENDELLQYLRKFSVEWGHSTYSELQGFVGYTKSTGDGVGLKKTRLRRRSGFFLISINKLYEIR